MSITSYLTHLEGSTTKFYLLDPKPLGEKAVEQWIQENPGILRVFGLYEQASWFAEERLSPGYRKPFKEAPFWDHVFRDNFRFMIFNYCEAKVNENPQTLNLDSPHGVQDIVQAFKNNHDEFSPLMETMGSARKQLQHAVDEEIQRIKSGRQPEKGLLGQNRLKELDGYDYYEYGEGDFENIAVRHLYQRHVWHCDDKFVLQFPYKAIVSYQQMPASFDGMSLPAKLTGALIFREREGKVEELHTIARKIYDEKNIEAALRKAFAEYKTMKCTT